MTILSIHYMLSITLDCVSEGGNLHTYFLVEEMWNDLPEL
jgi:hypothetical protein